MRRPICTATVEPTATNADCGGSATIAPTSRPNRADHLPVAVPIVEFGASGNQGREPRAGADYFRVGGSIGMPRVA